MSPLRVIGPSASVFWLRLKIVDHFEVQGVYSLARTLLMHGLQPCYLGLGASYLLGSDYSQDPVTSTLDLKATSKGLLLAPIMNPLLDSGETCCMGP